MEKPGDVPPLGIVHDGFEPVGLGRLLALAAAEEQGIEPDQAIVFDILDPAVVVEDSAAGVEAAVAAGMPVVGFSGGSHCADGHADRLIAAGCSRVFARMPDLAAYLRGEPCG